MKKNKLLLILCFVTIKVLLNAQLIFPVTAKPSAQPGESIIAQWRTENYVNDEGNRKYRLVVGHFMKVFFTGIKSDGTVVTKDGSLNTTIPHYYYFSIREDCIIIPPINFTNIRIPCEWAYGIVDIEVTDINGCINPKDYNTRHIGAVKITSLNIPIPPIVLNNKLNQQVKCDPGNYTISVEPKDPAHFKAVWSTEQVLIPNTISSPTDFHTGFSYSRDYASGESKKYWVRYIETEQNSYGCQMTAASESTPVSITIAPATPVIKNLPQYILEGDCITPGTFYNLPNYNLAGNNPIGSVNIPGYTTQVRFEWHDKEYITSSDELLRREKVCSYNLPIGDGSCRLYELFATFTFKDQLGNSTDCTRKVMEQLICKISTKIPDCPRENAPNINLDCNTNEFKNQCANKKYLLTAPVADFTGIIPLNPFSGIYGTNYEWSVDGQTIQGETKQTYTSGLGNNGWHVVRVITTVKVINKLFPSLYGQKYSIIHCFNIYVCICPLDPYIDLEGLIAGGLTNQRQAVTEQNAASSNQEIAEKINFIAYPNPGANKVQIELSNRDVEISILQLMDLQGRKMDVEFDLTNPFVKDCDISNLAPGRYVLIGLDVNNNQYRTILIKE